MASSLPQKSPYPNSPTRASVARNPVIKRQRGSTMVEFVVVGPVLLLLGLSVLQYGLLFFNKNHLNHATFMAARAGSLGHADPAAIRAGLARALVPVHGGGSDTAELAASYARALTDVTAYSRIELLNPTRESFDDWNAPALQAKYGRRAIPNGNLLAKDPGQIGARSGQSLQDANLLKLRVTYGYAPTVPLVGPIYRKYLTWLDTGEDSFNSQLIAQGRIPVVMQVTVQMHSDAVEPDNPVSLPGPGNNGTPVNPGEPPAVDTSPPTCSTIGCTEPEEPACDPASNPFGCRPPGCQAGDPSCDPACQHACCQPGLSWLGNLSQGSQP